MKAFVQSTLVAALVGTLVGMLIGRYDIGSQVWPAHPFLFLLFATLFATVVSQRVWSPDYFRRRSN
jgi:ABC-type microcin C transport system permease subunit YejE